VLQVDKVSADSWSMDEVITRWYRLFNGHLLVDRYLAGDEITQAHFNAVEVLSETWRARLYDISWFMKCLNEGISRQANKEDNCTGKFWEGRFKSQALLDETALLSCMAYVDLNPVRAGIEKNVQVSDYTSIQERLIQFNAYQRPKDKLNKDYTTAAQPNTLLPFSGVSEAHGLPFSYRDYFELVDWSGRHIDPKKRGHIDSSQPKLLDGLGLDQDDWLTTVRVFRRQYGSIAGSEHQLRHYAHSHGMSWYKGVG